MESAGLSLRRANQRFEPQWMRSRAEKDVEPMMRDEDVRQKTLPRPKQSRKHSQLRAAWRHLNPTI